MGVEEAKGGLWILKNLGNHPQMYGLHSHSSGKHGESGSGKDIDVRCGEISGSRMNG